MISSCRDPLGEAFPIEHDHLRVSIFQVNVLRSCKHSHVVQLLDVVGTDSDVELYIVMEKLEQSLQSQLHGGPINLKLCMRYISETLEGLGYLHSLGMNEFFLPGAGRESAVGNLTHSYVGKRNANEEIRRNANEWFPLRLPSIVATSSHVPFGGGGGGGLVGPSNRAQ